jgi:hypothetical protein
MKTIATMLALIGIACVFTFSAQSDEPTDSDKNPTFTAPQIGQELLDTLDLAFTQRLNEYKTGRAGAEHAIRLNTKLYHEQISAANADSRRLVTENYIARAKQIETIAKRNLDNGTGLSQELLEAKAGRLSATLELAKS